jgi:hypothetical protein
MNFSFHRRRLGFEHFRQKNAQKNPVNPVDPVKNISFKIESIPSNLKSA